MDRRWFSTGDGVVHGIGESGGVRWHDIKDRSSLFGESDFVWILRDS